MLPEPLTDFDDPWNLPDLEASYRAAEGSHDAEDDTGDPRFLGLTFLGWVLLASCLFWLAIAAIAIWKLGGFHG